MLVKSVGASTENNAWNTCVCIMPGTMPGIVVSDCDPLLYSQPGSSVRGIFQTRILEWVAISFSRGNSWPRNWTYVCGIGRQILYHWGTWEVWHVAICCCRCSVQLLSRVWLLRPHGLQHTRLPCPSPTPRAYSNSCPLSWWYHPAICSSVVLFSSCLQSFPAPGSFQMSQFFASGGQSIGVSASASVLPVNIQNWFPLGCPGWLSLQFKGLSRVFSQHHSSKAPILWPSLALLICLGWRPLFF